MQQTPRLHLIALNRHDRPRFLEPRHEQQVRCIAHLVALFVGNDLRLRIRLVPRACAVPDPHPRASFDGAILRRLRAHRHLKVA